MQQLVEYEAVGDGVVVLTLSRPEARNALSADMREALIAALRRAEHDDRVAAVVVTGKDGHFCAGGDIKTMGDKDPVRHAARMEGAAAGAMAVGTFSKPLVAAVAGHAAGAGVSLVCLSDVVVAQSNARFTVSFLRIGLVPDWGLSHTLACRVGSARARRMMMTCEQMPAEEAHRVGLVDRLCDDGDVLSTAIEQAKQMAALPPGGLAAIKGLMVDRDALAAALQREASWQRQRFQSDEHAEGIAAFLEKRAPRYRTASA